MTYALEFQKLPHFLNTKGLDVSLFQGYRAWGARDKQKRSQSGYTFIRSVLQIDRKSVV